ncbi:MAG TPA: dephospho-CoA kinase [Persephonella sp.]|uniref:Dephospho-CoA kinase n=1 Tax=Persephonella marina (strain DSM 14350 / EX-H1) TaxID=123214 RepID=C0QRR3_PERMH|nr:MULTISPECIES: dephospho-CoA kinase [Persephonella]ACO04469.1 dephospho-CoA kinase [Persephonella marina EX-H1]HCB69104.1 dephospho-CoA kinase [Persephonella sp.]
MLKVGLTGSIGTGKSTVGKIFSELGAYVIDADKVVHTLLKREDIKEKIRKEFGDVFDSKGEIDRKKLGSIVFKDPEKKKKLESIIHPEVRKEIERSIKKIEDKDPESIVIVEVPLLIETGSYRDYDIVILVYAPEKLQLERLIKKGFSKDEALRRIRSQLPIDEKIKYADIVIYNTGDLKRLREEVESVYRKLKEKVKKE